MSNPIKRQSYTSGFGPATLREATDVSIVNDNLVCGVCGENLDSIEWCLVSSPKRKGIAIFACKPHISDAMNMLGQLITGLSKVPKDLKLPGPGQN